MTAILLFRQKSGTGSKYARILNPKTINIGWGYIFQNAVEIDLRNFCKEYQIHNMLQFFLRFFLIHLRRLSNYFHKILNLIWTPAVYCVTVIFSNLLTHQGGKIKFNSHSR